MDAKEKALLIRAKIAVGLTPAQAAAVVAAQEDWDNDPAHPDNAKPAKPTKAEKPVDPVDPEKSKDV